MPLLPPFQPALWHKCALFPASTLHPSDHRQAARAMKISLPHSSTVSMFSLKVDASAANKKSMRVPARC